MRIVYIAGKYSDHTPAQRDANIQKAEDMAVKLLKAGFMIICPHTNTGWFSEGNSVSREHFLHGYLTILDRLNPSQDALFLLDNWQDSIGAKRERLRAMEHKIPIFYSIGELIEWKEKLSKSV